jgi:orotidine-5'-phosphate decarboxylase
LTVADHLTAEIEARNRKYGAAPYGPIGAVVGATCEDADEIAAAMPSAFILAPGVGAQGATMHDIAIRMPRARGRVLPNVSRAILANGATIDAMRTTIRSLQEQARELA